MISMLIVVVMLLLSVKETKMYNEGEEINNARIKNHKFDKLK